jgi:hypothetical protein
MLFRNIFFSAIDDMPFFFEDKTRNELILVEDDGESLSASATEIQIAMEADERSVRVSVHFLRSEYEIPYSVIWFVLPIGDNRTLSIVSDNGLEKERTRTVEGRVHRGLAF